MGAKIMLVAICPVIVGLAATMATFALQQRRLGGEVERSIRDQAFSEAAKVAHDVYLLCAGSEQRNQRELDHSLSVAHDLLHEAGEIRLDAETVPWRAVNQLTNEASSIELPKFFVGGAWCGQVAAADKPVRIVDDATRLTGDFCTIFQRMNEAGDMLRVATSVHKTDGTRAIGTFIPVRNPDGTDNSVLRSVLRGETYRGRAFVVSEWHAAAYEPIWDAGRKKVIGMLYVGVGLKTINRELHDMISRMVVGKTGYAYVIGGQGDERGKYIVSQDGKRDGENIWDARDADGRAFIQSIIGKAVKTEGGSVDHETYSWQNPGEAAPRTKFVATTYFAPWHWVIGAGAYEDDFAAVRSHMVTAQRRMLLWVVAVAAAIATLAGIIGFLFSRGIARPIAGVIAGVSQSAQQISSASDQTAAASQSLAQGSSEQAASLEEISASLEEMAGMTKRNAENAANANELARLARQAADGGVTEMKAMSSAMHEIKNSSDDIAKIIKTIDEIAFQTNILALNAAVEAARAGESGMGFAVVAEEVRSLAQRSAHAARETAEKIEGAIAKTAQGVRISDKVGQNLTGIVEKVRQVDALVAEVANASREQSQGVEQINTGVREMDRVVQTNAAAAQESAGAAHELNSQAHLLNEAVEQLQLLVGGLRTHVAARKPAAAPLEPAGFRERASSALEVFSGSSD